MRTIKPVGKFVERAASLFRGLLILRKRAGSSFYGIRHDDFQNTLLTTALGAVAAPASSFAIRFLLIWVLICASAGARPEGAPAPAPGGKPGEFSPALKLSTYEPTKTRDPFDKSPLAVAVVSTAPAPGVPVAMPPLRLDGILYSTVNPSASVNGQLLTLNKTVRLDPMGANIPVKAVAITRQQVTLEIMGQKVELKLNADKPPAGK